MNSLESYRIMSPYDKEDECARFSIDDTTCPFVLHDVTIAYQQYTYSMWLKADTDASVTVCGSTFPATTEWKKYSVTFTAASKHVRVLFNNTGVYYIYRPQLEIGEIASDWIRAPEDVDSDISDASEAASNAQTTADDNTNRINSAESQITQLADSISMLITDENGQSKMTQTADGWRFDISTITGSIDDTASKVQKLENDYGGVNDTVNNLSQTVDDLGVIQNYVVIKTLNDQPCIELGKLENSFKVRITNTDIQFIAGGSVPAYVSNQKLMIEQAEVQNELQFGGFAWKKRSNGNMGIVWKGVDQ